MNLTDYANLDAVGLNQAWQNDEVSADELLSLSQQAVAALNPLLNAVTIENPSVKGNLKQIKPDQSPIAGAPFLLKDVNVFTADMPTTFSCRFFADAVAKPDSEIVRRWREGGLLVLGKSNTPEFAEDYVCESTFRGPALNPWNPGLTTGGSSGGAAAAVASGMVPIAHGTDLGGSIRIPAACCGIYGMKPTSGLSPTDTTHPELSSGLNSDHVLTRSVRDCAAALDLTAYPVIGNRYHQLRQVPGFLAAISPRTKPQQPLRIGVCTHTPDGKQTPARQQAAVKQVSDILSANGHTLVDYRFPPGVEFGEWFDLLWMFDIVDILQDQITLRGREPKQDELEALTHYIRAQVATMSALDYYQARQQAHRFSRNMMTSMEDLDILLTPALAKDPVAVGSFDSRSESFHYATWMQQGWEFASFSPFCNVTGQPAASIPVFLADETMPCAVQIAGHTAQDHIVLQLSAELEQSLDWQSRRPPTWAGDL